MRKVMLFAIALLVIAVPAMAGLNTYLAGDATNPTPTQNAPLKPIIAGIAQQFVLQPGVVGVVDINGNIVIDPFTGMQQQAFTWATYMRWARGGFKCVLQGVTLQKIHPFRKAACDFSWPVEPVYNPITGQTVVTQKGSTKNPANPNEQLYLLWDGIQTVWPLLYEVDGTLFELTVVYTTPNDVHTDQSGGKPGKQHTDIYRWPVVWNSQADILARISYFANVPGSVCEVFAIPPLVVIKLLQYLNGYGNPALGTYVPGIFALFAAGRTSEAYALLGALESFIDQQGCIDICSLGQGSPFAMGIVNNSTMPVASLLLNDLWAWAKASGLFVP